jgi:general secretion pathway protein K
MSARHANARGAALLIVLWITTLLAILLGSFVVLSRTESLQTRHLFEGARARYAAEAGIARAVYELRRGDPLARWIADGRAYEIEFESAKVKIEITDESGKVDINAADEEVLLALFGVAGAEPERARALVDAVMDWRDPDDLVRTNGAEDRDYEAADYPYGAADVGFVTIGELQQVMGMDFELYRQLEPLITVYSRSTRPNPAFASAPILQTLPGMTPELAQQLVELRRQTNLNATTGAVPLTLPDGTPLVPGGGGLTYTVTSRATLKNGASTVLDATLRLGGPAGGRAYSILRWREGSSD